jgi:hypothetical protein
MNLRLRDADSSIITMKHARSVYRAEKTKGEARSFRRWVRLVYADLAYVSPKLKSILRRA